MSVDNRPAFPAETGCRDQRSQNVRPRRSGAWKAASAAAESESSAPTKPGFGRRICTRTRLYREGIKAHQFALGVEYAHRCQRCMGLAVGEKCRFMTLAGNPAVSPLRQANQNGEQLLPLCSQFIFESRSPLAAIDGIKKTGLREASKTICERGSWNLQVALERLERALAQHRLTQNEHDPRIAYQRQRSCQRAILRRENRA